MRRSRSELRLGVQTHDGLEGLLVPSVLLAQPGELAHERPHLVRSLAGTQVAIALTSTALQRARRTTAEVERHGMRGRGAHDDTGKVEVFAVVLEHLALPGAAHHLEHLVHASAAGGEIHPVDVELLPHPSDPRAQDETALRERRQRGGLLRHLDGMAQRQHVDAADHLQTAGHRRHGGTATPHVRILALGGLGRDPGVRVRIGALHLLRIQRVVGTNHPLEAQCLRELRDLAQLLGLRPRQGLPELHIRSHYIAERELASVGDPHGQTHPVVDGCFGETSSAPGCDAFGAPQ